MIKTGAQKWNIGEDVFAQDLNDTFDEVIPKIYSDGRVANQLTDDADIPFGQNNATGKKNKIYQIFKAKKPSIFQANFKKGTTTLDLTNVVTDATFSTPTYSEVDSVGTFSDDGVISSTYRQVTVRHYAQYQGDYVKLSKTFSGLTIGRKYKFSIDIDADLKNLETDIGFKLMLLLDNNLVATYENQSAGSYITKTYTFIATATSHVIDIKSRYTNQNTNNYGYTFNFKFKNGKLDVFGDLTDIVINFYSDNSGALGTLLGSKTILKADWENISAGSVISAVLSSPISITIGSTYWIELSQTTGSALNYPAIRKISSNAYADGALKSWNTTDGFVSETGDLYFEVIQNTIGVIPQTGDDGKIPLQFIGQPIYGDASDGSVTLSGTVNIARDMFYDVLTIASGAIVNTNGYRIFGNELINNGTIQNNGANASGNSAGAGGYANGVSVGSGGIGFRNSYYWDYAGGGGGGGGIVALFFKKVTVGGIIKSIGGNGGVGAINQGGSGSNSGNAYGSGGSIDCTFIKTGTGGKGGGGASNGGTITTSQVLTFIYTNIVNMFDFVLSKTIKGGAGGGGGQGSSVNSTADGGGGGQGGLIILLYSILISDATYDVSGGLGGAAVGAGNAGSNGSSGRVLKIKA